MAKYFVDETQEKKSGALGAIGSIAFSFIGYSVASKVGSAIFSRLNRSAGNVFRGLATRLARSARNIERGRGTLSRFLPRSVKTNARQYKNYLRKASLKYKKTRQGLYNDLYRKVKQGEGKYSSFLKKIQNAKLERKEMLMRQMAANETMNAGLTGVIKRSPLAKKLARNEASIERTIKNIPGIGKKLGGGYNWIKSYAKSELRSIPILYGMNKMQQRGVPEEYRENFASWYVKQMPFDIMYNIGMSKGLGGLRKAGGRFLNRMKSRIDPRKVENVVEKGLKFLATTQPIFDRVTAFSKSVRESIEKTTLESHKFKNILKDIPYIPKRVKERYDVFKDAYRRERARLARRPERRGVVDRLGGRVIGMQPTRTKVDLDVAQVEIAGAKIDLIKNLGLEESTVSAMEGEFYRQYTRKIATGRGVGIGERVQPTSKGMDFFNDLLKNVESNRAMTLATDSKTGHVLGRGLVKFKDNIYDIRGWLPSNISKTMGDMLGSLVRVPAFFSPLSLFNAKSYGSYRDNSRFITKINRGAIDLNYSVQGDTTAGILSNLYRDDTGEDISQNVLNIIRQNSSASYREFLSEHEDLIAGNAKFGKYFLRNEERAINLAGSLFVMGKGQGATEPYLFKLGYDPDSGQFRNFRYMSGSHNSIFERTARRYMGGTLYETATGDEEYIGFNEFRRKTIDEVEKERRYAGQAPLGKVGRKWYDIKEKFDLGGAPEPSIFMKAVNYINRYRDPRYGRTFFSDEAFFNKQFRNQMFDISDEAGQHTFRLFTNIASKGMEKSSDEAWMRVYKNASTHKAIEAIAQSKAKPGDEILSLTDYMIHRTGSDRDQVVKMLREDAQKLINPDSASSETYSRKLKNLIYRSDFFEESRRIQEGFMKRKTITYADDWNSFVTRQYMKRYNITGEEISKYMVENRLIHATGIEAKMLKSVDPMLHNMDEFKHLSYKINKDYDTIALEKIRSISDNIATAGKGGVLDNIIDETFKQSRGWNFNHNIVSDASDSSAFFIPEPGFGHNLFGQLKQERLYLGQGKQPIDITVPGVDATFGRINVMSFFDAVNRTANYIGLGFSAAQMRTPGQFLKNVVTKRILPAYAIAKTWGALDAITDEAPIFEDTPVGEGLNVFMANQLVKARLGIQGILDDTGATSFAQWSEDVMPGSIKSPMSGLLRGFGPAILGVKMGLKTGGPTGAFTGGAIGAGIGLLLGGGPLGVFGTMDISKSRDELLKEYTGEKEVAIRKGRWWELSSQPFWGEGTSYFSKNWYHKLRSDYKHTPNFLGTKFEGLSNIFDPNYFAEQNYLSRPYPISAGYLENIPVLGNTFSFGRQAMHQEDLPAGGSLGGGLGVGMTSASLGMGPGAAEIHSLGGSQPTSLVIPGENTFYGNTPLPTSSGSPMYRLGELGYNMTEMMGLRGFMFAQMTGSERIGTETPMMASPSEISSPNRAYWDLNAGGVLGMCLTGNADILTKDGIKQIKDLTVGNDILGKNGFVKIINVTNRDVKDNEKLYTIYGKGYKVSMTGNHQVYVLRLDKCKKDKYFKCKPNLRVCQKTECNRFNNIYKPIWINAEEINKQTDMIGTFINKKGHGTLKIDFEKYGVNCSNNKIFRKGISNATLEVIRYLEINGCDGHTRDSLSKLLNIDRDITHRVLQKYRKSGYSNYHDRIINIVDIDLFSWFCGLYLGDGSITYTNIDISHSWSESDKYYDKLCGLKDIFNVDINLNVGKHDSWKRSRFNHIGLSKWINDELGKYYNSKKLPSYIWNASLNSRLYLIGGLIDSDGCIPKRINDGVVISMKNKKLLKDVQQLLMMSGIYCTINTNIKKNITTLQLPIRSSKMLYKYSLKLQDSDILYRKEPKANTWFIYDNILWRHIEDISISDNKEKVYDIQLDDSFHGFIADTIIVHNSEIVRRVLPRPRQWIQKYNPLRNIMPTWMPSEDYYIDFLHGDPYCVSPNTIIEMSGLQFKFAKAVLTGEYTYTHMGHVMNIKAIIKRYIDKKEKAYKIKVNTLEDLDIGTFSEEHPLLVKRNRKNEWKKIQDVQIGDYVVYPIPKVNHNIDTLDLKDILPIDKFSFSNKCVIYGRNVSKSFAYQIDAGEFPSNNRKRRFVNRYINLEYKLMFLIGLFFAKGWTDDNITTKIRIHKRDYELIQDIIEIYKASGICNRRDKDGKMVFNYKIHTGGNNINYSDILIEFKNEIFTRLLTYLCGINSKKRLLSDIFLVLNKEGLSYFLNAIGRQLGFLDPHGGYYIKELNRLSALQLRKVLLSYQIISHIKKNKNNTWDLYIDHRMNVKFKELFKINDVIMIDPDIIYEDSFIKHYYLYLKVKEICEVPYNDILYGFEVPNDDSFCVAGIATHNTKIQEGELRLPGAAHEASYTVDFTFPVEGRVLGMPVEEQVLWYVGDAKYLQEQYKKQSEIEVVRRNMVNDFKQQGLLSRYSTEVYDPKMDLSAKVDAVIHGEMGPTALVIAPMSDKSIEPGVVSNLNAYLNLSKVEAGMIIGFDKNTGQIEEMMIRKDVGKFLTDLQTTEQARATAAQIMEEREKEGYPDLHANAYSRLSRLEILGDVAPHSKEYMTVLKQVKEQERFGQLTPEQMDRLEEVERKRKERTEGFTGSRRRFYNVGTPVTEEEQIRQTQIDKEYSSIEKALGGTWEWFTSLGTPLHSKMLDQHNVLDEYARNEVYGKGFRSWNKPLEDFVKPAVHQFATNEGIIEGALGGYGWGMFLGGGPILSSLVGGAYGAFNKLTGVTEGWIPEYRREERRFNEQFDALEYQKYMIMYEKTGDVSWKWKALATITGSLQREDITYNNVIYAAQKPERKYIREILKLGTKEEREYALELLPKGIGELVESYWNKEKPNIDADYMLHGNMMPGDDWIGFDPGSNMQDIQVKAMENAGLNSHDVGLNFYSQANRMDRAFMIPDMPQNGGSYPAYNPNVVSSNIVNKIRAAIPRVTTKVVSNTGMDVEINLRII